MRGGAPHLHSIRSNTKPILCRHYLQILGVGAPHLHSMRSNTKPTPYNYYIWVFGGPRLCDRRGDATKSFFEVLFQGAVPRCCSKVLFQGAVPSGVACRCTSLLLTGLSLCVSACRSPFRAARWYKRGRSSTTTPVREESTTEVSCESRGTGGEGHAGGRLSSGACWR